MPQLRTGGTPVPSDRFKPNPVFMRRAIDEALENLRAVEGGPFGACLVRGDEVLAVAHITVLKDLDPTCHGETNAIRLAARKL
jgi:guanine deaminase